MVSNVVDLQQRQPSRLSRDQFKARIVALVEAGCVKISGHLKRDHPERHISPAQIEKCLLKGTVQTDPSVNRFGNWESEVYRHMAGQELIVVAAIEWEKQVIVVTAYEP